MSIEKISYLILLLLPLYLIKLPISDIGSINLLDVFLLFHLGVFIILIFFKKIKLVEIKGFFVNNFLAIFGLFLIILGLILSFLENQNPSNWADQLGIIKSFYLLPILFSSISAYLVKIEIIKKRRLISTVFFSSCLVAFIGFFYLIFNKLTFDSRLSAIFNSPNYLAMYLAVGMIIIWWIILFSQKINKNKKTVFQILFLLFFILLIFTKSAGAVTAVLICLGLLYLTKKSLIEKSEKILLLCLNFFIALNVFFMLLFCFILPGTLKKMSYSAFENRGSLDSRLVIYQVNGKILQDHFFWGIGAGNFQEVYLNYQQNFPPYPQWAVPHPHNLFLSFWLEAGASGLIGLILIFFQLSRNIKSSRLKKIDFIPSILIIYFLIHGLIDSTFWKNDLAIIFWLMVFLSFKFKNHKHSYFKK
ncbi:MAG: hypothetical protein GF335_01440 [Candidatus Moranbacteria bacterium]|nr:hypothetical protein [Candidatus Moranbacteria bacterium]